MGGVSNTTNEMVIGNVDTYQRTFLIVAGSLLALLVVIAAAGTSGSQHLQSSVPEIAENVVALADYQVDSANLVLTKDIFGLGAVSEKEDDENCTCNEWGFCSDCCSNILCWCP